jgi:hypothetical protein
MSVSRIIELCFGMLTVLSGLASGYLFLSGPPYGWDRTLRYFLILILPTCVIGLGVYVHALRRESWGLMPILTGGLILSLYLLSILLSFDWRILFSLGYWGWCIATPGTMAFITMLVSLINHKRLPKIDVPPPPNNSFNASGD